jgi:phage tail sheath protein FI
MPEYLAPGVFVEEVSYRSKSIEGVGTTTTAFVGPTRFGPLQGDLEVLTSLGDFERTYGDGQPLQLGDVGRLDNYVWHAVRAFFEEGGSRLYVKRVFLPPRGADGRATAALRTITADADLPRDPRVRDPGTSRVRARFPGAAGNGRVELTLSLGPNVLSRRDDEPVLNGVQERDVVWVDDVPTGAARDRDLAWPSRRPARPLAHPHGGFFAVAVPSPDPASGGWELLGADGRALMTLSDFGRGDRDWRDEVRIATLTVTFTPDSPAPVPVTWAGLPLDPQHRTGGALDSATTILAEDPPTAALARTVPIAFEVGASFRSGLDLLAALVATAPQAPPPADPRDPQPPPAFLRAVIDPTSTAAARTVELLLRGGGDGNRPGSAEYVGDDVDVDDKSGLKALEDLEDVAIVAVPGATFGYERAFRDEAAAIVNATIRHAERMRYRIAVLDSGEGQGISDVAAMRGTIDTTHAALYYPWITVLDPITRAELQLPPSGFVCGIYARNDVERAVWKAPANEVVGGAIGFERLLNKAQQEVLNPLGVNCFRFFEGRGHRLWGARTASSDPEWKYVNLRRYFAYLENSIDRGTQWAVFEPNGERLWANVRATISDFLFNEFQNGALLGEKPEHAFFVTCDRSTMTQNDLDNGRLICLIGVAPTYPAEFVIFRIGQWTADSRQS